MPVGHDSDGSGILGDPGALGELQARRLARTLQLCAETHPFYRERLRRRIVTDAVADALEELSLTTKEDFIEAPERFRLEHSPALSLEESVVREVMYTTGTSTGRPVPVYNTAYDYFRLLEESRRGAAFMGLDNRDRIGNVFPLTPFVSGGFAKVMAFAVATGASVVVTRSGRSEAFPDVHSSLDETIGILRDQDVTVLWGITSFVDRLIQRVLERGERLPALRACLITGEASSDGLRERLAAAGPALGVGRLRVIDRYGFTEGVTLIACPGGQGWHNLVPDQYYLEAVDPGTGARVGVESLGALAVTHLDRRGTVLLRYLMGDLVRLTRDVCPGCGLRGDRVLSTPQRFGTRMKIKGTMVDLASVADTLDHLVPGGEFQLVVRGRPETGAAESLLVRIADDLPGQPLDPALVVERILAVAHIRPDVEFVARRVMFDPDREPKRRTVVDETGQLQAAAAPGSLSRSV